LTLRTAILYHPAERARSEASAMADHESLNAFLGKGSHFEGKLTFEGKVKIDGTFVGEIFSGDVLVLGEGADVKAEIDVGTAIIQGKLTGNVRAQSAIELKAPGEVRGNIEAPAIQIDKGVYFEGACKMTKPTASAARPAPAPMPVRSDLGV
jgi:cytoskeletal protein CcmA (bactofilin family)